jgi:hypothetical protein
LPHKIKALLNLTLYKTMLYQTPSKEIFTPIGIRPPQQIPCPLPSFNEPEKLEVSDTRKLISALQANNELSENCFVALRQFKDSIFVVDELKKLFEEIAVAAEKNNIAEPMRWQICYATSSFVDPCQYHWSLVDCFLSQESGLSVCFVDAANSLPYVIPAMVLLQQIFSSNKISLNIAYLTGGVQKDFENCHTFVIDQMIRAGKTKNFHTAILNSISQYKEEKISFSESIDQLENTVLKQLKIYISAYNLGIKIENLSKYLQSYISKINCVATRAITFPHELLPILRNAQTFEYFRNAFYIVLNKIGKDISIDTLDQNILLKLEKIFIINVFKTNDPEITPELLSKGYKNCISRPGRETSRYITNTYSKSINDLSEDDLRSLWLLPEFRILSHKYLDEFQIEFMDYMVANMRYNENQQRWQNDAIINRKKEFESYIEPLPSTAPFLS